MRLIRQETGHVLAADLREARGPLGRMRGLMAKTAMPGDGLLIEPADSIHTFFMRMPIDLIFLDRDGRVVKRCPAVPPWRIRLAPRGARLVLELPAGFIARHAIEPGDSLAVVDRSPPLSAAGGGRTLAGVDMSCPRSSDSLPCWASPAACKPGAGSTADAPDSSRKAVENRFHKQGVSTKGMLHRPVGSQAASGCGGKQAIQQRI